MHHLLSTDAHLQLQRWSIKAQRLFFELLDDAGSDLQREFLRRAVVAGHSAPEVYAFADALRGLSDDEAYSSCTFAEGAPPDFTVAQLLRAEADPLSAFELKGGTLEPNEELLAEEPAEAAPVPIDALALAFSTRKAAKGFVAESADSLPASRQGRPFEPRGLYPLCDALNEASRPLNVVWKEEVLDVAGGLTLASALEASERALNRGIPLPCSVGPKAGEHGRFVVLLQVAPSGKSRSWQLYDPYTAELVWAHENDILAKVELPFANKSNRRLTRIFLPQGSRTS